MYVAPTLGPQFEDAVAFTVWHEEGTLYAVNERITYNHVMTNVGGGYMAGQHEFICPHSGNSHCFAEKCITKQV